MDSVCFALVSLWAISGFQATSTVVGYAGKHTEYSTNCPPDYRRRVKKCIIEAKVAPQAGGGINLVTSNDTIIELCERGLLKKAIDCLQDVKERCKRYPETETELDRLYNVQNWMKGTELLCENPNVTVYPVCGDLIVYSTETEMSMPSDGLTPQTSAYARQDAK